MTVTTQIACLLSETPARMDAAWCVYEHLCNTTPDPLIPPEVMYVGACQLRDVFTLTDARNNSEWMKLFGDGQRPIIVRVVCTTDKRMEAMNKSVQHVRSFTVMPRCNLYGHTLFGAERAITCSNGHQYSSQSEAARILNCSQSAISENLAGKRRAVKGLMFAYKE